MRSPRFAITLVFLADGLLVGSWAARIPAIKHHVGLTTSELGLVLFAVSLGALVTMPLAGWLCERTGSRAVVVVGLLVAAAALTLTAYVRDAGALAAALFLFGAGFGAVNVAANAQGLALEGRRRRSVLSSFHAAYSAGGLIGAGLGALAAAAGVAPSVHFGAVSLVVATTALATRPRLLPPADARRSAGRTFVRPPAVLVVLGIAAFFTLLGEGAAADWSALYLSHSLGASAAVAALAYSGFALGMATSRVFGDRLGERVGPVALVRGGALTAACGLALALAVGTTASALAGFAVMGGGLGVVVPVLFRAAGTRPALPAGIGVAAVSTIGFFGFLAGPPAIGLAAGAVGLRDALSIVVLSTVTVALLAPSAGTPRRALRGSLVDRKAVLSDLDGVLVDSAAAIEVTWRRFAARHCLNAEHVLSLGHGRRSVDLIRLVAPHLDAGAEAARIECEELELACDVEPLPGARELMAAIPAERFAIVTSGSRALALARLCGARLPIPSVLVTGDEVTHGKPDPAPYLRAASLLGVDPAHSLVLEDAPAGVAAGRAAGMTVIAVLTTNSEEALQAAHTRIRDLTELLPNRRSRLPFSSAARRGRWGDTAQTPS